MSTQHRGPPAELDVNISHAELDVNISQLAAPQSPLSLTPKDADQKTTTHLTWHDPSLSYSKVRWSSSQNNHLHTLLTAVAPSRQCNCNQPVAHATRLCHLMCNGDIGNRLSKGLSSRTKRSHMCSCLADTLQPAGADAKRGSMLTSNTHRSSPAPFQVPEPSCAEQPTAASCSDGLLMMQ